jgi:hypothetical protein
MTRAQALEARVLLARRERAIGMATADGLICESWDLTNQTLSDRILSDVLGAVVHPGLTTRGLGPDRPVTSRSRAAVRQRRRA